MKIKRSGWLPSTFDARDFVFSVEDYDHSTERLILQHPYQPRDQGWGVKNVPCWLIDIH